jgi:hypothetical protein
MSVQLLLVLIVLPVLMVQVCACVSTQRHSSKPANESEDFSLTKVNHFNKHIGAFQV